MSHAATNWAIQQRGLKPTTKIVLWHLCDRFNPDYGCFPSQVQLAYDCEISRATLNRHLDDLETSGLIRRIRSADIAVAGQTVRIFALPGQVHAGVGTEAQLQSGLAANLFTTAVTSIELRLTGTALDPQGTAQSRTAIDARLSEGRWSSTAVVQGYRAPPGLGRSTAPNAAQGGSVVTVLRGGSVLSRPRSGRILQG